MTKVRRRARVMAAVTAVLLIANSLAFTRSMQSLATTLDWPHFLLLGGQKLLVIGGLLFLLVGLFWQRGHAFRLWVGAIALISAGLLYYTNNYGVRINSTILNNVLEAKDDEIGDFLDLKLAAYLLAGLAVAVLFYRLPHLPWLRQFERLRGWPWEPDEDRLGRLGWHDWAKLAAVGSMVFLVVRMAVLLDYPHYRQFIKQEIGDYAPLNLIAASAEFGHRLWQTRNVTVRDSAGDYARAAIAGRKPLTIVLVIGESARGDRFALNGYGRDTNPLLSRTEGLRYFSDASACDTSTVASVSCMFSRLGRREFSLPSRETSLVGILRRQGFATYWYSLQRNSTPVGKICGEAEVCIDNIPTEYDTGLLPHLDRVLAAAPERDTLVVLHTRGSHTAYHKRVPKEAVFFTPVCSRSPFACDRTSRDNAYDNSIRYTDRFLADVIGRLKSRNAFLIYASDHGESLGEVGITGAAYGHATPYLVAPKPQTHVPMLFWSSPGFADIGSQAPASDGRAAAAQIVSTPVSHDNIFHSVLDCAGIASPHIRTDLSFCR